MKDDNAPTPRARPNYILAALALLLGVALATLLGFTYFGHSPSPYGACYSSSGRSIPCALVATR